MASLAGAELTPVQVEYFEKNVRPILVNHCYSCHSVDAEKSKGGLLVDSREALLKGGDSGKALIPGDPEKSRLIQAVRYANEELQMPPKEKLAEPQIAILAEWVKMGAPDPRGPKIVAEKNATAAPSYGSVVSNRWVFRPPAKQPLPKVKNRKWPKQPLDYFILSELEERKLQPAPPADKRALIRRAYFDLIGLPPKPEEVDAFVADTSPDAYPRLIDRLLASPHFGERWGRHWLDVARYADSNGLEVNLPYSNAWRYRDYVINAYNADKPFDQFIREQLAGDLLPVKPGEDDHAKMIATGFLVLGPKLISEPDRQKLVMDTVDEQIEVTSKAFLGLTVSCARCHDHKFDPIPTRDYYALAGIFKSTMTINERGAQMQIWSERPLAAPEEAAKYESYQTKLRQLETDLERARRMKISLPGGLDSKVLEGIVVDNAQAQLTGNWKVSNYSTNFVDKDYIHDADEGKGRKSARFVPNITVAGEYEVRLAYTPRENRATNVPVIVETYFGPKTVYLNQRRAPALDKAFVSIGVFEFPSGTNSGVIISNAATRGFVVADAVQFIRRDEEQMQMASLAPKQDKEPAMSLMASLEDPETLTYKVQEHRAQAPPPLPSAMAVREGEAGNCRVHIRGDHQKLGDEVPRGFLKVVNTQSPALKPESSGRLELAEWIASSQNPLTARVYVNRVWQHLFGRGLVGTPDNFGALGETPTHPELLDELAVAFMADGWSTKKLIRKIMLSSAYQMSSKHDPKAYAKDPDNKFWWRMNRKRLEAEILRDSMLFLSGKLDLTRGGPVLPTNAIPNAVNPEEAARLAGEAFNSNRRSIYLPVVRNEIPDLFQVFDFVDPHVVTGKRHTSTAATQALFMMNSPYVQEQAKAWAASLQAQKINDPDRINLAMRQAFARPATAREIERSLQYLQSLPKNLGKSEAEGRALAWETFCQALLASAEARFIH